MDLLLRIFSNPRALMPSFNGEEGKKHHYLPLREEIKHHYFHCRFFSFF